MLWLLANYFLCHAATQRHLQRPHTRLRLYGFLFYGTASKRCHCPHKHYLLHMQLKQKNILHAKHFGLI